MNGKVQQIDKDKPDSELKITINHAMRQYSFVKTVHSLQELDDFRFENGCNLLKKQMLENVKKITLCCGENPQKTKNSSRKCPFSLLILRPKTTLKKSSLDSNDHTTYSIETMEQNLHVYVHGKHNHPMRFKDAIAPAPSFTEPNGRKWTFVETVEHLLHQLDKLKWKYHCDSEKLKAMKKQKKNICRSVLRCANKQKSDECTFMLLVQNTNRGRSHLYISGKHTCIHRTKVSMVKHISLSMIPSEIEEISKKKEVTSKRRRRNKRNMEEDENGVAEEGKVRDEDIIEDEEKDDEVAIVGAKVVDKEGKDEDEIEDEETDESESEEDEEEDLDFEEFVEEDDGLKEGLNEEEEEKKKVENEDTEEEQEGEDCEEKNEEDGEEMDDGLQDEEEEEDDEENNEKDNGDEDNGQQGANALRSRSSTVPHEINDIQFVDFVDHPKSEGLKMRRLEEPKKEPGSNAVMITLDEEETTNANRKMKMPKREIVKEEANEQDQPGPSNRGRKAGNGAAMPPMAVINRQNLQPVAVVRERWWAKPATNHGVPAPSNNAQMLLRVRKGHVNYRE